MTPHPELNFDPIVLEHPVGQKGKSAAELTADFIRFHEANPHIYEGIARIACHRFNRGVKKFSIRPILDALRFENPSETDDDQFMVCGNHSPFYARLLACDIPELRNWFSFKLCKADTDEFHHYLTRVTGVGDPITVIAPPKGDKT